MIKAKTAEKIRLSDRLRTISGMVTDHSLLLDVGCDHAYVSINLVSEGRARLAYATDVRQGPLEAARRHIEEAGLSERIQTAVCDGIPSDFKDKLPLQKGEHRSLVIAGMGGRLILSILERGGKRLDDIDEFILSPQSEYAAFRAGITKKGLVIQDEILLKEEGKFYVVLRAIHAGQADSSTNEADTRLKMTRPGGTVSVPGEDLSELQLRFGPRLLEKKSGLFLEYLGKRKKTLEKIADQLQKQKTEASGARLKEIEHELGLIDEAMA